LTASGRVCPPGQTGATPTRTGIWLYCSRSCSGGSTPL